MSLEICLPPIEEQRNIVGRIEDLVTKATQAVNLRNVARIEADALSASVLSSMLPHDAPIETLRDLVAAGSSISYGVLVPGSDIIDGVPFVRVQDLDIKNPSPTPNKRIAPNVDAQYMRTRLSGGEVLIAVVGSIGKIGIAPASWAGANIARAVCRIVPGPQIDSRYLAEFLSDRSTQDYFKAATRTLAQPTLNVAFLAGTPIKVPPLAEQRRIITELDDLQAKIATVKLLQAETATTLGALVPSILDRAFSGQL